MTLSASITRWSLACAATLLCAYAGAAPAQLVYIGTQGDQIHALRLDTDSGALTALGPVARGLRPTWVMAHPNLPLLYAVDDDNSREGSVTAFSADRASGALTKINAAPTGGKGTTYLWLDLPSNTLLAANYAGGSVASLALDSDGTMGAIGAAGAAGASGTSGISGAGSALSAPVSLLRDSGSGPHRRQAGPHAHAVVVDPSGHYALVPDLGADRVFVYGFDRVTHALLPGDSEPPRAWSAPPGSGPRHLAFGADGRYAYLISELSAEISTLRWDAARGRLTTVQSLRTSSAQFTGVASGAEIAVSRDGRRVYVDDRGENALLVYRVDADSGKLSLAQRIAAGGDNPWGFGIDPSGRWLLVANQRSGSVNVFRIDAATGMLSNTGVSVALPAPVSIAFLIQ